MKSRKVDVMKDAGIDPVISELISAHKKARIKPGFFVGVCVARCTLHMSRASWSFLLICKTTLDGSAVANPDIGENQLRGAHGKT